MRAARGVPGGRGAGALRWAGLLRSVHILPGRLRLRVKALKGRRHAAGALESHLGAVEGISRVEVSAITGSLLLHFDPRRLSSPAFLDACAEAMGKAFPGHFAPGRLRLTVRRLRGDNALAAAISDRLAAVPGIERLEIDPATGACLLVYDSEEITKRSFVEGLREPLEELLPGLDLGEFAAKAGLRPR
jgi:hypothetical protein